MDMIDPKLYRRLHALVAGHFESSLTDAEHQELATLLVENAAARRLYVEYLQETACLRWLCLEEYARPSEAISSAGPPTLVERTKSMWRWAPAALMTLACSLLAILFANRLPHDAKQAQLVESIPVVDLVPASPAIPAVDSPAPFLLKTGVATVTALESAQWIDAAEGGRLLSRCQIGQRWQLSHGCAELTFDSGVLVTIFAPAEFDITSGTSIRCRRGRVTALVDERGKGFTVETPQATVIDLGTQFGLDISDDGQTQVVVFQGSVDLMSRADGAKPLRMEQGDALLLDSVGGLERLVAVRRDFYLSRAGRGAVAKPLILDVEDNIRQGQRAKSYQIVHGGFGEDVPSFVDRDHEWNGVDETGLPEFLLGADYIMPFNDDKFLGDLELTVTVARPAMLYIFLDNNMEVPDWLRDNFTDTGIDIGLDGANIRWHPSHFLDIGSGVSIDFTFSVWRRNMEQPGTITLGGVTPPPKRPLGFNMYGVAAVDLERATQVTAP